MLGKGILFLDIDGVLNSIEHARFRLTRDGQSRRDVLMALHEKRTALDLMLLDEKLVELLAKFVIQHKLHIVITSTWRENSSPLHFQMLFGLCGHPLPTGTVIGLTPVLDHLSQNKRGHEIQSYLDNEKVSLPYVVLDDDVGIFLEGQPVINTSINTGLTKKNLNDALKLLASSQ